MLAWLSLHAQPSDGLSLQTTNKALDTWGVKSGPSETGLGMAPADAL